MKNRLTLLRWDTFFIYIATWCLWVLGVLGSNNLLNKYTLVFLLGWFAWMISLVNK